MCKHTWAILSKVRRKDLNVGIINNKQGQKVVHKNVS